MVTSFLSGRHSSSRVLATCGLSLSAAFLALTFTWAAYRDFHQSTTTSAPLRAEPAELALGNIGEGTHQGVFSIVNQSSENLRLLHAEKSCSCTQVLLPAKDLKPNERTEVRCAWDTRGNRGQTATIALVAYRLATDEAEIVRKLRLTMSGIVTPDIAIAPDAVRFDGTNAAAVTIAATSNTGDPFEIVRADCTHPAISVTVATNAQEVSIIFDPSKWTRKNASQLEARIHTSSRNNSVIRIPVLVGEIPQNAVQ